MYVERNEALLLKSKTHQRYSQAEVDRVVSELFIALESFASLCEEAAFPVNLGCCRSQCCCCMTSLFHEPKQMGLVLGRSFKGTQVWIPPIPVQLRDIAKLKRTIKDQKIRNEHQHVGSIGAYQSVEAFDESAPLFDLSNHKTDLKIDAMFFSGTDDMLRVLGEEFTPKAGRRGSLPTLQDRATDQEEYSADDRRFERPPSGGEGTLANGLTPERDSARALHAIRRTYLDLDTVMICNPNAMSYQHMINYPHAYYLKYFLNKNMNVLVWNYRGYGRTKGRPEPALLYYEAE